MNSRATFVGTILSLAVAVSVSAQETAIPADVQRAQQQQLQQQRQQIQIFQGVLQMAVRQGSQAFVRQQAPTLPDQIQLTANDPEARGFAPPQGEAGILFYVSVPNIRVMITELLVGQLQPRRQESPLRPTGTIRRGDVNAAGLTGAQGVAPSDPMTADPAVADTPLADDGRCAMRAKPKTADPTFSYWYAVSVCDALMDAMLDNSSALGIRENEWLTIMAVPEQDDPGVIDSTSGHTTYLQIKGSDLMAYRQGKVSKEEARKLVKMTQQ